MCCTNTLHLIQCDFIQVTSEDIYRHHGKYTFTYGSLYIYKTCVLVKTLSHPGHDKLQCCNVDTWTRSTLPKMPHLPSFPSSNRPVQRRRLLTLCATTSRTFYYQQDQRDDILASYDVTSPLTCIPSEDREEKSATGQHHRQTTFVNLLDLCLTTTYFSSYWRYREGFY